jgi:hypothetical protein
MLQMATTSPIEIQPADSSGAIVVATSLNSGEAEIAAIQNYFEHGFFYSFSRSQGVNL